MKALVTGGAGFIGSHLVEYLERKGVAPRIFDRFSKRAIFDFVIDGRDYIEGDIRDSAAVHDVAHDCDVIFHLAGSVGTDYLVSEPEQAVATNVLGTLNILETAKVSGAKVIYLSVLPDWPNSYMITKKTAERFCRMYHEEFGTPVTIFQGSHIYGPRQSWRPARKAVPNFILRALNNETLDIYGTGQQLMDLLYVTDACRALYLSSMEHNAIGCTIELGSGSSTRVIDLARWIVEECRSRSSLQFVGKRPGEPLSDGAFRPADISLLQSLLDFSPQVTIAEGLRSTIAWYREQVLAKGVDQ